MLKRDATYKSMGTIALATVLSIGVIFPSSSYAQEITLVMENFDTDYQIAFSQTLQGMDRNLIHTQKGYFLRTNPSDTDIVNSQMYTSLPGTPIYNSIVPFIEVPTHITTLSPEQYRGWTIKIYTRTRYINDDDVIYKVEEIKTEFYNKSGELQDVTGVAYPEKSLSKQALLEKLSKLTVIDSSTLRNMMRLK